MGRMPHRGSGPEGHRAGLRPRGRPRARPVPGAASGAGV